MSKIIGPTARLINPFRIRLFLADNGWEWTAQYRTSDGCGPSVSGCTTRREAIFHLYRSVTMRIVRADDGEFVRLPPLSRIFVAVLACACFVSAYIADGGPVALIAAIAWGLASASTSLRWVSIYRSAAELRP